MNSYQNSSVVLEECTDVTFTVRQLVEKAIEYIVQSNFWT